MSTADLSTADVSTADGSTVLVTGGSGFLGGWCLYELLRRGYEVRTTVRRPDQEAGVRAALAAGPEPVDAGRLTVHVADLGSEAGWREAIEGCGYVLHVASPFPFRAPRDPDELIVPARDGTLRILRLALAAGVRRVVLTSSTGSSTPPDSGGMLLDESCWTDPDSPGTRAYIRSKTIAERAAWSLVEAQGRRDAMVAVLPGAMLGPVRGGHVSYSVEAVAQLLAGAVPGLPRLGFPLVDVRDVADLHLRAMTAPAAAGRRFLATDQFLWLSDVARILRDGLGDDARKVPTRRLPNFAVRLAAMANPPLRQVVGDLGRKHDYTTRLARETLGWRTRPIEESVLDCARSLLAKRAKPAVTV